MSKFSKPKPTAASEAEIERVIQGADAVDDPRGDDRKAEPIDQDDVRFTMTLPGDLATRVDRARKAAGGMTRLAWLRLAAAEKLARDGV
jgi:hypothetical protein